MTVYRHQRKWRYDFWKEGQRFRGMAATKQEARTAEAEARKRVKKTNLGFIRLCASRLRELRARRTRKYLKENLSLFKKLIKIWGQKKEVTREDVETYLNGRALKSTIAANKELRFIKALLNHGVERGYCDNPASKVRPYPVSRKRKYIPSEGDIKAVFAVAAPMDRLYLMVIAQTMGRISAVNQIRWSDVNLTENYVSLFTRKAKNSNVKEIRIPMNRVLRACFELIPQQGEYVFINPKTGKPYDYRSKFLKTLCKKAKVQPFGYHSLRHFGASRLDNKGVALSDIQRLLGHEKASTTAIYLQSLKGSVEKSVELLEDLGHPLEAPIAAKGRGRKLLK
jgi:integrase